MKNMNDNKKINTPKNDKALDNVLESAKRGELVIIAGAGISVGLSAGEIPSWNNLITDGLSYCKNKGLISESQHNNWQSHLNSDDIDELLSAAEFMSRKMSSPKGDMYIRWLQDSFRKIKPKNSELSEAIGIIKNQNIPICTLNYDTLLENITNLPSILMTELTNVTEWIRGDRLGILHLHGSWESPETCILSIRDYQNTLNNEIRDLFQRSLCSFKRLLFIGCGSTLSDPNFSALIEWLRKNMPAVPLQHYSLVRNSDVAMRHADKEWHGFVEPISFGENFDDLPIFLKDNFQSLTSLSIESKENSQDYAKDAIVLDNYRRFLIKDCGQMTIEGVKADMDTTKQKFNIEKLFVPLNVSPCPPEFSSSDPERENKLSIWIEKNSTPIPFGKVLSRNKRIALLALPGGGKTMLLKRLAVAYADPDRRAKTIDFLPEMDIFPILIRCREWREHIKSPILTLLKNIPEITGQANLIGLEKSIKPLLISGKILLLIDGLDEIHNNSDRETFVENLEKFLEEYSSINIVITSREAGFSLVAPCLNRFCEKFRVAPLNKNAIELLCEYWHILMTGPTPESIAEAKTLANHMVETNSLRRLAENPLLLTMLLVVKHGAGRLPPDRVSLYGRAVEVLLDTWNIKGHDALNLKEAIPQLACVAFELMKQGKQTATEHELLRLLEEAREKLPQIERYARDTPYDFLKRVELRSSLLLEAGHQIEDGITVPFYQFRHLTFQEYLAAIAASSGHFIGYKTNQNALKPLEPFLLSEEWKEVVPMTAVLAGKQAEPIIKTLVTKAKEIEIKLLRGDDFEGKTQWTDYPPKLPASVARLTQCLVEEAEASQEILTDALKLIVIFGRGCRSEDDWKALVKGPYGVEIIHQAWNLYENGKYPDIAWVHTTCTMLAAFRKTPEYWKSKNGKTELLKATSSTNNEQIGVALLTCVGLIFSHPSSDRSPIWSIPRKKVETLLFRDAVSIWQSAAWIWSLNRVNSKKNWTPENNVLDRLLLLWTEKRKSKEGPSILNFAITQISGVPRMEWQPKLNNEQIEYIIDDINQKKSETVIHNYSSVAACVLAFYARGVISESALARKIYEQSFINRGQFKQIDMLSQMGKIGEKYIEKINKEI